MRISRRFFKTGMAITLAAFAVSGAHADHISFAGDTGSKGLGHFQGTLDYTATDVQHAILTLVLKNTSPTANGGYLTGFAFNNPGDQINGVLLTGAPNFKLLGGPTFQDKINGAPFGHFDIGATSGKTFQGGGSVKKGIAAGAMDMFTFALTGVGLDKLTAQSFLTDLSVPPGASKGNVSFEARFRGFQLGGADHVPVSSVASAPEPSTIVLAGFALLSLSAFGWYFRRG